MSTIILHPCQEQTYAMSMNLIKNVEGFILVKDFRYFIITDINLNYGIVLKRFLTHSIEHMRCGHHQKVELEFSIIAFETIESEKTFRICDYKLQK